MKTKRKITVLPDRKLFSFQQDFVLTGCSTMQVYQRNVTIKL